MYKRQVLETRSQFCAEYFVVIIMSEAQKDMFKRYGNNYMCFESALGLNCYGFEPTTFLILDDLNQGFPCGFMFSNRGDT